MTETINRFLDEVKLISDSYEIKKRQHRETAKKRDVILTFSKLSEYQPKKFIYVDYLQNF